MVHWRGFAKFSPRSESTNGQPGRACSEGWGKEMTGKHEIESSEGKRRQLQGLPVIRRNVAGIDLGSERHWVCAPTADESGREIASFGATTAELIRMAEWLKARGVESVAMESTGVYWIAPQEVLEAQGHQALDEVGRVICTRPTGWVLEIDVTAYFDTIVREHLMEMIEKRVRDGSVLRLIRKWIQVGVIDEGRLLVSETGTGQGQTISPLLANIYLHFVLDEWFENEVKPRLKGAAYEIRFADDAVLCFQYKEDAEKVMEVLPKRFAKYGLTIHPEKTRLLEFGRYAEENAKRQGKKPATFDFLGFSVLQKYADREVT